MELSRLSGLVDFGHSFFILQPVQTPMTSTEKLPDDVFSINLKTTFVFAAA
jgi:hypothetical protein